VLRRWGRLRYPDFGEHPTNPKDERRARGVFIITAPKEKGSPVGTALLLWKLIQLRLIDLDRVVAVRNR
jgi:hypothetical protein